MPFPKKTWVDVPEGQTPAPGTEALDAEALQRYEEWLEDLVVFMEAEGNSGTTPVETVAALRALDPAFLVSKEIRKVLYHTNFENGGGGEFLWLNTGIYAAKSWTVDAAGVTSDTIFSSGHGYKSGTPIRSYGTSLAGGVATTTTYYVAVVDANNYKLALNSKAAVEGGPYVDITSTGSGQSNLADNNGSIIVPTSNPATGRWVRKRAPNRYSISEFGGLKHQNCQPAIQSAVDFMAWMGTPYANYTPGCLLVDLGTYYVDSTLYWRRRVSIEGQDGGASNGVEGWPQLRWRGPAADDFIVVENFPGNTRHHLHIHRVTFGTLDNNTHFRDGIVFPDRCDLPFSMSHFQISQANGNPIRFNNGVLNVHLTHFRIDGCAKGIYVGGYNEHGAHDIMSMDDFTVDNSRDELAESGLVLEWDGSNANDNTGINFTARDGRVEVNTNISVDQGMFWFKVKPTTSNRQQVWAYLDNVQCTPEPGVTSYTGVRVTPKSDYVMFNFQSCQLTKAGIPAAENSKIGTVGRHALSVVAPWHERLSPTASTATNAQKQAVEFAALFNLMGPMMWQGMFAPPVVVGDPANVPSGVTVEKDQRFILPVSQGATSEVHKVCDLIGTAGTLSGVTGSGTAGAAGGALLTVNDISQFRVGQYISIAGSNQGVAVVLVNPLTNQLTLSSNLSATVTDAAVSFRNPTYRQYSVALAAG